MHEATVSQGVTMSLRPTMLRDRYADQGMTITTWSSRVGPYSGLPTNDTGVTVQCPILQRETNSVTLLCVQPSWRKLVNNGTRIAYTYLYFEWENTSDGALARHGGVGSGTPRRSIPSFT